MIKSAVGEATPDNSGLVRRSESRGVKCFRLAWTKQKAPCVPDGRSRASRSRGPMRSLAV